MRECPLSDEGHKLDMHILMVRSDVSNKVYWYWHQEILSSGRLFKSIAWEVAQVCFSREPWTCTCFHWINCRCNLAIQLKWHRCPFVVTNNLHEKILACTEPCCQKTWSWKRCHLGELLIPLHQRRWYIKRSGPRTEHCRTPDCNWCNRGLQNIWCNW